MVNLDLIIILIPLLPLAGFITLSLATPSSAKGFSSTVACGAVLVSFILSAWVFLYLLNVNPEDTRVSVEVFNWITAGDFAVSMSFLIDPLSSIMLLVITGVGFLIHVYSIGYMHDDEGYTKFFSYLNLFVFFMLLLVMGSNYLIMFIGWEGVGLCSYLLIGFWFRNQDYNAAANKAFIMNRIGDLGLLVGLVLIFINFGSLDYQEVFSAVASADTYTITTITILLFIGAMGKSAQIPLYTWLPDAMAGPTPVSALIHAATMVTAGVYMVARNNLLYTLSPISLQLILIVGLATALFAATIALTQNDIKKVLAYSTVSQLGLMFVALGCGAYASGIFHMVTHAFFKALLFLCAGSVIHALHHEQDIRKMGGLKKFLPVTYLTFFVGVLAISGIPPFAGFFSKDEILADAFMVNPLAWGIALIASLLTVFYMFRLFFLTFYGNSRASAETLAHVHESPKSMAIPLIVLAILSVVGGFINIPESLFGKPWLKDFLEPVFAQSETMGLTHHPEASVEYTLMGIVIVMTLVVIGIAYSKYVKRAEVPQGEEGNKNLFHQLVYNKYYVDEFYDALVVRPLHRISVRLDSLIERGAIDRFVNASGQSVSDWSRIFRLLQNGSIGFYIFIMVMGIVLMLTLLKYQ